MSGWANLIPQTGLTNAWPWDTANTTSSTATDPIGSQNATLTSCTLNGSGPNALLNNAGVFNGTSSHGDTAANIALSAFSLTTWFNLNAGIANGAREMADDHTDSDNKGFQILYTGGNITFHLGNGTTFTNLGQALATGAWHMVTYTYDGTTLLQYMDGVVSGTTGPLAGPVGTPTNNISFGFNPAYSGDFAAMMIAGTALYNRVLTGAEVTTIFNLVNAPAAPAAGILGLASSEW
jgi:hypothetical protein